MSKGGVRPRKPKPAGEVKVNCSHCGKPVIWMLPAKGNDAVITLSFQKKAKGVK